MVLIIIESLAAAAASAQVFPDRHVVLDPLGDHYADSAAFTWLTSARLFAEFSRYTDNSSDDHRWNAKTGGIAEVARWDSSASVALVGTMEVVVDPHNDITFNPRAIFWEEGVMASFRLGHDESVQAGYIHRCKHDIDNAELIRRGGLEQRTLIYSGIIARLNARARRVVDGSLEIDAGAYLRNDLLLHLLDDRLGVNGEVNQRESERMINATTFGIRAELRPRGWPMVFSLSAAAMLTLVGREAGFSARFADPVVVGSVPYTELGLRFVNPAGSTFSFFLRGEWQRDAGIGELPERARLLMFGVRVADRRMVGE